MTKQTENVRYARLDCEGVLAVDNWLMAEREISDKVNQAVAWDSEMNSHVRELKQASGAQ